MNRLKLKKQLKVLQQSIFHPIKEIFWDLKYLKFNRGYRSKRIGVVRVDGRSYHGGLTDRFKGIITWWHYCEENNIDFKIHYTYPFQLTDYIVPNDYDWRINESDIPDSISDTCIFYGRGENGKRLVDLKTTKSIWYYGNMDISHTIDRPPYNLPWGETFKKLFKPSDYLEYHLDIYRRALGQPYVAAVYRFQNLLGDFKEYSYKSITDSRKSNDLIDNALRELTKIRKENPKKKILVTSDSSRFLAEAARLSYVYVIPGDLEHIDCPGNAEETNNDNTIPYLKSFLDFFMISESEKVYSVVIGEMYPSQFPEYAAKINDIPFVRIVRE